MSSPMISLVATIRNRGDLFSLAEQIHKALKGYDYELLLAADHGIDEASSVAEGLPSEYPVKVLSSNGRPGSAVAAGLNQARGEVLGVIEAGSLHSADRIPQLLRAIQEGADIAIASRYVPGGGIKGCGVKGRAISRATALLARLVLPSIRRVKDPLSGFFLLRRKVLKGAGVRPVGHKILLGALTGGSSWEVREVPHVEERLGDRGGFGFRDQVNCLARVLILVTRERELRRLFQFGLVGLSGVGVNMGTFWLLTRIANLNDLAALILGLVAATLSNFTLNDLWTFKDRRVGSIRATLARAMKFNLVSAGAIALYYATYTPLTRFLGMYDLAALAIAILIGVAWNFSINVLWTWKKGAQPVRSDR